VAVPFVLVNLMPGALPRYSMPLLAPAIWLLGVFIRSHALLWPKQLRKAITCSVVVITAAMLIYSLAIIPLLQRREKIRPIAAQIDAAIPPNESLYAINPDYQPFLFYLQRPIIYVSEVGDLPREAHYLLIQPADENAATHSALWTPRRAEPILRIKDYRGRRVILLRVENNSAVPD
jgi:hypothetical protein